MTSSTSGRVSKLLGARLDATQRARAILGGLAGGGLVAFSMPPWGWWPLAFVGIAIADRVLAGQSVRARLTTGMWFGAAWFFPATLWMAAFTPIGFVAFGLLGALWYAIAFALVPAGRGRVLALPAILVLTAAFQWSWPFGGVPIASLAISQAAGWFGPLARTFGSLWLVGVCGIAGVGLSALTQRRWRTAGAAVAVLTTGVVLTLVAPAGTPVGELDIAIVQGGGEQGTRALNTSARAVFERHMAATETLDESVDVILWPENVITIKGPFVNSKEFFELGEIAARKNAPIVAGLVEQEETTFNNASAVVNVDGSIGDRYDKVQRVPFGEWVPFRSIVEQFAPEYLPKRNAVIGTQPAVVEAAGAPLGVSISWEVFFDRRAREAVESGGEVLLNPTNGSSYSFTMVQSQQIASSQLRAHETGRWVAQAAPTGFSAIITPAGEIIERSDVSEARVITGTVERRTGTTWAVAVGWWPAMIVSIGALVAGWAVATWSSRDGRETS